VLGDDRVGELHRHGGLRCIVRDHEVYGPAVDPAALVDDGLEHF
jgi:hypothetical protein